jgi:HEAT repeat protein
LSDLATVVARLASPDPSVRRLAIHDLIAATDADANGALLAHLPSETDERAALLIIRHAAASRLFAAMPVLMGLYGDRRTPVRIAHAAILAHDTLAGALESVRGNHRD